MSPKYAIGINGLETDMVCNVVPKLMVFECAL